ncbi:MAG: ABC transporter permease [Pseudorhodoplanes sp.]
MDAAHRDWALPFSMIRISRELVAAMFVAFVGAACLLLSPRFDWLGAWPDSLTVPATEWIGAAAQWTFGAIKPAARLISDALGYPMRWSNFLLVNSPYSLTIGIVTACGWYLGGWRTAALAFVGLGFVLCSGYWIASMNTLALVAVSVPLALLMGFAVGLAAYEMPSLNRPIQTILDVMQTVPTFAYLTPLLLLFGFGPVVGLIASVIYAAPPMARNLILGLQRVEPDIREAAVMGGAARWQQLFLVELPSATQQIMVGVNQTIMAALSMVIIAAVIGGFNDIGWEVLLTMRKAAFGQSLLAGLVIVVFAILLDRMSGAFASEKRRYPSGVAWAIVAMSAALALVQASWLPAPQDFAVFKTTVAAIDRSLAAFIADYSMSLNGLKNGAMYYFLLPLRIGLAQAVLPFTWGFQWTPGMSLVLLTAAALVGLLLSLRGRPVGGVSARVVVGILVTGITNLPWPFVLAVAGALGWVAGGWKLAAYAVLMIVVIPIMGLWVPALLSVYLCGAAVVTCVIVGGAIGVLCAISDRAWAGVRPVCDMLQTIPLFVFLIPVLMFFQIGEFSAFLAICAYAVVPMIRYTRHGLVSTPDELVEAAVSSGATDWQVMREVRMPYAAPTLLLGLNQTILYAFSMLVIAALVGTTDLGQQIYLALGQADVGLGLAAGASMAILALVADRLVQAFAESQRKALGL